MAATSVRLYSDWTPADGEAGTLTLTLSNMSDRPLENFRLAFTSHIQLRSQDELSGARLLEQISGYHVIAPPADFVLTSGATWLITARGLNYTPRHYSAGLRSAYLILADREIMPVEAVPTTRKHESGMPRLEATSSARLPRGALPVSILRFPQRIDVAGHRDTTGALYLVEATHEAQAAFHAAAALAKRLFLSDPELFGDAGIIACLARHADMPEEAYRIDLGPSVVTLLAAGRKGFLLRLRHSRTNPTRHPN